jgi:hypothetical protein
LGRRDRREDFEVGSLKDGKMAARPGGSSAPGVLTSHFSLLTSRLAMCLLAGLCATGCSRVCRVEQVDRAEQMDIDDFLHEQLPREAMITTGEAYRALLLLADGEERYNTFQERECELQRRHWIRCEWNLQRAEPIDVGAVAYIVIRMIHGERGVNSLVFGSLGLGDRRYALRDLTYMGLIENEAAYRWITGGELLNLMGRADDYMAGHNLYPAEPVDLRRELEPVERPAGGQP